jgi:nitrilase
MTQIAAVQMISGPDVAANLTEAAQLIGEAVAAGAELVMLPENFAIMPKEEGERIAAKEKDGNGPIQDFLSNQARRHHVWLVGGTIPLESSQTDRVRSACLLMDADGERAARYDKIHLFDVKLENGEEYQESGTVEAGEEVVVVKTPVGMLGLAVCYDLRFPELFRHMLDRGAEIFAVPSAFTAQTGKAHWEILVRARAIENLAYVVAPGQGGHHANGRETHGHTMIVSPWGEVLGRLAHGPGIIMADVDRRRMQAMRASLPSIEHRRFGHDRITAKGKRVSA